MSGAINGAMRIRSFRKWGRGACRVGSWELGAVGRLGRVGTSRKTRNSELLVPSARPIHLAMVHGTVMEVTMTVLPVLGPVMNHYSSAGSAVVSQLSAVTTVVGLQSRSCPSHVLNESISGPSDRINPIILSNRQQRKSRLGRRPEYDRRCAYL